MTCILHISDTHFGTECELVVQAVLAASQALQPDLVVLSGDITQRARASQFAAARVFIQALQCPVLAVPGNHDVPLFNVTARLLAPYGGYKRALGAALEPVFENAQLLAIGVNSTRAQRHKNGVVSALQVDRVARRLQQAGPQQLRIVVLHHPVRAKVDTDRSNLLIGREHAVPAWVDAGADLILAGHIHLPYALPVYGLHNAQSQQRQQGWTVQAGTAVSRRVRGNVPNSFNVIRHRVDGGRHLCVTERWDYEARAKVFQPVENMVLDLRQTL